MAAKHSVRVFGTARFILSFAVAILVLLVVWIAVRAVGPAEASRPPTIVLPSVARVTIDPPPPTPSVKPSVSRTPSKSPSPSKPTPSERPTTARATTAVPEKTRTTTKPPPPPTEVEATLAVTASWEGGYVAMARVTNEGERPVRWKVTVSHADLRDLELRNVWNATGNLSGDSIVFTGGPLDPGRTADFGYQTSKDGRGDARPAGCNAVGGTCRIR
ncbi:cellulose-binding domain-containing protein [Actinoplanes sp. TRM 88003]|uniref:Cellulose-binding domain-containing protein n=1 Tax=Paractinoplanes aksuensis TaxID=2939490 RepID=A0ABT1DQ75_9ACTN|nr:cellulose binding domain-containing protein [Actinoplanes aksuensis]MCO8272955.1 cellulose-binding domain-containing protein [Actinoplanes aksuensis]